jgi:hypothetical protein
MGMLKGNVPQGRQTDMDAITSSTTPDVVTVTTEPRPTPTPFRTSFADVMARSAGTVVGGAEAAMTTLPGTSLMAAAVRGSPAGIVADPAGVLGSPLSGLGGLSLSPGIATGNLPTAVGGLATPAIAPLNLASPIAEGPGANPGASFGSQFLASASAAASGDGGAGASLQQSAQSNLYYLQLQQQMNQQSQAFEAMSNMLKSESDTVKNAISNMH